jgi:hypothetical protein
LNPVDLLIKGRKCPLLPQHLQRHAEKIREAWNALTARNPKILYWLNKVKSLSATPSRRVRNRARL